MTAAPIGVEQVRAALRPHRESVMLPTAAYLSPEVYAWERRHLFAGSWTCLGRVPEPAPEVTQRSVEVGDVGVLLTMLDGQVRGFANVCPATTGRPGPIGAASTHPAAR
jgi:Rieske 2Fe-2S family protein